VNQDSQKVSVQIFGEIYVIRGNGSEDYISGLAADLDKRMHETALKSPRMAVHQVATLVALNLLDELAKLKEEQKTVLDMLGEKDKQ